MNTKAMNKIPFDTSKRAEWLADPKNFEEFFSEIEDKTSYLAFRAERLELLKEQNDLQVADKAVARDNSVSVQDRAFAQSRLAQRKRHLAVLHSMGFHAKHLRKEPASV